MDEPTRIERPAGDRGQASEAVTFDLVFVPDGAFQSVDVGDLFRFAGECVSGLIPLFIGYLIAAFDPEKRTVHDHIAGTRVIKV